MDSETTRDHIRDHTETTRGRGMKFSDKYIDSLRPTDKLYDIREGKGFGVRVLPSGVKTWFFIYRFDGKRRFMNLGHYPSVSLKDAGKKYRDAFDLYEQGKDPLTLFEQSKDERSKAPTIALLTADYIERHAKRFKRSWEEDERILNKEVVAAWGKKKAEDITKRDVINLLDKIIERGAPAMANNAFQVIRKMFNFATEKDLLKFSPCIGVKLPSPKVARDRVLSLDEIKTLWLNLEKCAMSDDAKRALKLILVTAQRPGEVAGIHAGEIDGRWWTIPAERAKNGNSHRVYLTDEALELIGDTTGKGFVFPTPHKAKERSIDGHALAVAVLRNLAFPVADEKGKPVMGKDGKQVTETRFGIGKFTPHDLRRTAATFMAESGEMDEVIDAIMNHAKQGVIKVYNQFKYDVQKRAALETWARKLAAITTGTASNVIPMRRKTVNAD
jgi:integrase